MSLYTTTALVGVIRTFDRPSAFLLDAFFPTGIQFDSTEIAFDKLKRRRKLAPFVSPHVPGKARRTRGRQVQTFEPAYVKPKDVIEPGDNFFRLAGEAIGGELTPDQRYMANVTQILEDQDREITRREEWMASQIMQTGSVIVAGEDYPSQTVDFGRNAAHTVALVGASRWGETGVSPRDDIATWATIVAANSGGTVRTVVMGAGAAELLQKDDEIKSVLDNRRQATGRMELGPVATGGEGNHAAYIGSVSQFDFWQYTQAYEDEAGVTQQMFPHYGVLLVAADAFQGFNCHAAIRDNKVLRAMSRFPDMWDDKDPSVTNLMTQSAPLPVPGEVDASMFITVR